MSYSSARRVRFKAIRTHQGENRPYLPLLITDTAFAMPYLLRPIEHGADIVIDSVTTFIGGSGAATAGALAGKIQAVFMRRMGATLSPFHTFLFLQEFALLPLRVERHMQSALDTMRHSGRHPLIKKVCSPQQSGKPEHALYRTFFP